MDFLDLHGLSVVVFFPLFWALVSLLVPGKQGALIAKYGAFLGALVTFFVSLLIYHRFQVPGAEFQLTESATWIPVFGISYSLGIDGISLWLILLTTFLMPIVILASYQGIQEREREYYFFLLSLETGMLGAFASLDLFLFYIFWEAMLIPMYFLIGIWGGKERVYAAMKFILYTVVGSLLMLVAIFYLAYQHRIQFGEYSTALVDLYRVQIAGGDWFSPQSLLFLAFAFAFAIKVPLFPFHTWLPDAHVEAPTAGSVILAGVLLKMGGYGFIRFAFPLFPQAVQQYQILFLVLSVIAILYGAWVSMVQPDIKKLVAYSSVSHMGYVMVGLFSLNLIGATGSIYQMLSHGISTGGLFLLVGMIYERRHSREIRDFGGISKVMPLFAIAFMIITLSSIALPGTNGFVGEFLILLGAWKMNPWVAVFSAAGVIFGAIYMLWAYQRVMFGPIKFKENTALKDLSIREVAVLLPVITAIFFMGVFPNFFFQKMEPSVKQVLSRSFQEKAIVQYAAKGE